MQDAKPATARDVDKKLWELYKADKDKLKSFNDPKRTRSEQNGDKYMYSVDVLKAMNLSPYNYSKFLKPTKYRIAHLVKHIPMEHFCNEAGWDTWIGLAQYLKGKRTTHKRRRSIYGFAAKRYKGYRSNSGMTSRSAYKTLQRRRTFRKGRRSWKSYRGHADRNVYSRGRRY